MRRRWVALAVGATATIVSGGLAYALSIGLSAPGGPAGSSYTAQITCGVEPELKVRSLDVSPPAATLVPLPGVETSPGVWTFDLQAGARDQVIGASCGSDSGRARFDVEEPVLLPGPTVDNFGAWRPDRDRTSVVGTDCPAGTTATVQIAFEDVIVTSPSSRSTSTATGRWTCRRRSAMPTFASTPRAVRSPTRG